MHRLVPLTLTAALLALAACAGGPAETPRQAGPPTVRQSMEKWDLWTGGTRLRGANIYQRRVYPEIDGEALGNGPVGPRYTQRDFGRLAALGANYVNISHPGLFTEEPPYRPDPAMVESLDRLLEMAATADLFAVISFRTGPGRSEFTFSYDDAGTWFDRSMLNDTVWRDAAAQDAWAAMWRYTAERYRDNPVVVGYDLMTEPNANHVWLHVDDPEAFYPAYEGTLYDWNRLHPRIAAAVREVDADTPLLVGAMNYSAAAWLPYLQPTGDPRTVYTFHQYAPFRYVDQPPPADGEEPVRYPGAADLDGDSVAEAIDRGWLARVLAPADGFARAHGVPVAVNEFGVSRWAPGAAEFLRDEMDLFEERGLNHALWLWRPLPDPDPGDDAFSVLPGPNPDHHGIDPWNGMLRVVAEYWARNAVRPSNVEFPSMSRDG